MWMEGGENVFEAALHGFQIPVIHLSLCFNKRFIFLASCASLDPCEEYLSAGHFLHLQNVSSGLF